MRSLRPPACTRPRSKSDTCRCRPADRERERYRMSAQRSPARRRWCERPCKYFRHASLWVVEEPWRREVEVAVQAARQAAELALRYQPGIVAETKSDNSPVTEADRACERLIAQI